MATNFILDSGVKNKLKRRDCTRRANRHNTRNSTKCEFNNNNNSNNRKSAILINDFSKVHIISIFAKLFRNSLL